MRLIDADALMESVVLLNVLGVGVLPVVEEMKIKEQPTVDAVEVKHGHWEHTFGYVNCSICDAAPLLDGEKECMETTYCPWCGAKMDEVTE